MPGVDQPAELHGTPLEVFVVNYLGGENLLECISSLYASDYPAVAIRIIDYPPYDPVLDEAAKRYPGVEIIKPGANRGYAGAMHIAAAKCSRELLVICNNDLVFEPDCLGKMVDVHESSGAASVSARIVNPDESPIESGFNASLNPFFYLIHGVFNDRTRAVYPSGACFLIEKKALADCLPPEEFFL